MVFVLYLQPLFEIRNRSVKLHGLQITTTQRSEKREEIRYR